MQSRFRIPTISISNNNGTIRLEFRLGGQRYRLPIPGGYGNKQAMALADTVRDKIKEDILLGVFDGDMSKYDPRVKIAKSISEIRKYDYSAKTVWEYYKAKYTSTGRGAVTTKKSLWRQMDNMMDKVPENLLQPDKVQEFIEFCKSIYSVGTLERNFGMLSAASNLSYKHKQIPCSPWNALVPMLKDSSESEYKELKAKSRKGKAYSKSEVEKILNAFYTDRFNPESSAYKHSYYACFVEFLFLTGCRPEDAIALTWDDIKDKYIVFNKAYSKGCDKDTKTGEARIYPITPKIKELLDRHLSPDQRQKNKLVFTSYSGKNINLNNFTSRVFKVVCEKLYELGEISDRLPTYHLRHSNITALAQTGKIDLKTIAALTGTSVEMMNDTYFAENKDIISGKFDLPEI